MFPSTAENLLLPPTNSFPGTQLRPSLSPLSRARSSRWLLPTRLLFPLSSPLRLPPALPSPGSPLSPAIFRATSSPPPLLASASLRLLLLLPPPAPTPPPPSLLSSRASLLVTPLPTPLPLALLPALLLRPRKRAAPPRRAPPPLALAAAAVLLPLLLAALPSPLPSAPVWLALSASSACWLCKFEVIDGRHGRMYC